MSTNDTDSKKEKQVFSLKTQLETVNNCILEIEQSFENIVKVDLQKFSHHQELRQLRDEVLNTLSASKQRLSSPKLRIATIATTSAGKSTFVNALTGRLIAPISVEEMSAGILKIIHNSSGYSVYVEPTAGAEWPTGNWPQNTTNSKQVYDKRVYNLIRNKILKEYRNLLRKQKTVAMPLVTVETKLLLGCCPRVFGLPGNIGIEIMDLPGLNSIDNDSENLEVIKDQMLGSFCVMVLDYNNVTDSVGIEQLLDQLQRLTEAIGGFDHGVMFVLNKFNKTDCADTPQDIQTRITRLREGIKARLSLTYLPEIINIDARSWMYAQCAWGTAAIDENPNATKAVRYQMMKSLDDSCLTELRNMAKIDKETNEWFIKNRDKLKDLSIDELRFLLKHIIYPNTGATQVLDQFTRRLNEFSPELIILPAIHDFIIACDSFLSLTSHISESTKISTHDDIKEAINNSKKNIELIKKNLENEKNNFSNMLDQIREGYSGVKNNNQNMVERFRKEYSGFFLPLETFSTTANDYLIDGVIKPLATAADKSNMGFGEKNKLEKHLKEVIPLSNASDVVHRFSNYCDLINEYRQSGGEIYFQFRKDDPEGKGIKDDAINCIDLLSQAIIDAVIHRSRLFLTERAALLEDVLYKELNIHRERLKEVALNNTGDITAVEAVFQHSDLRKESAHLRKLSPNIFKINQNEMFLQKWHNEQVTGRPIVEFKRNPWLLWFFKRRVETETVDDVAYERLYFEAPDVLVEMFSKVCEQAQDDLMKELLVWINRAFTAYIIGVPILTLTQELIEP